MCIYIFNLLVLSVANFASAPRTAYIPDGLSGPCLTRTFLRWEPCSCFLCWQQFVFQYREISLGASFLPLFSMSTAFSFKGCCMIFLCFSIHCVLASLLPRIQSLHFLYKSTSIFRFCMSFPTLLFSHFISLRNQTVNFLTVERKHVSGIAVAQPTFSSIQYWKLILVYARRETIKKWLKLHVSGVRKQFLSRKLQFKCRSDKVACCHMFVYMLLECFPFLLFLLKW